MNASSSARREDANNDLLDGNEELDQKGEDEQRDLPSKVEEMSPNERYVRFAEVLSYTEDIKVSYRGFDTRNGIEVAWHAIDLSGLNDAEQEEVARSANSLKDLDSQYIAQYLSVWVDDEPRRLIIITALLESLKEFIGKVRILRWRIVKKWCRQILRGLSYLHTHNPRIVHRNLSCEYIYINGGEGQLKVGNTWLAAILGDDSDPVSLSETMTRHSRIIGSPAYNGPEIFEKRALDTKADIYSLGICMVEIITRSQPYAECKGVYSKIAKLKMSGVPPLCLLRISNPLALNFIHLCLRNDPNERPTADELKRHPFLEKTTDDDEDDRVILEPLPELPAGADGIEDLMMMHAKAASLNSMNEGGSNSDLCPCVGTAVPTPAEANAPSLFGCCAEQPSPAEQQKTDTALDAVDSVAGRRESPPVREVEEGHQPSAQRSTSVGAPSVSVKTDMDVSAYPHSVSGRPTPRGNSKFGKEFAALYKGEDVREDKGVQDGRRPQQADVEEDDVDSDNSAQLRVAPVSRPPVVVRTHSLPDPAPEASQPVLSPSSAPNRYDVNSPVKVSLKIDREHTVDGEGREVEFIFNPGNDDFQIVAKEMIEELALTLPINNLASTIENEVVETQRSVIRAYTSFEEERRTHGVSVESADAGAANTPPPAPTAEVVHKVAVAVVETALPPNTPVETAGPLTSADAAQSAPPADSGVEVDGSDTSPATAVVVIPEGEGPVISRLSTTDTPTAADDQPTACESSPATHTPTADESDDDGDMIDLDEEDRHLKQEIMRIDKESGHARRVFEQRILKHKSIQASLEEDIENRLLEYNDKLESISKKLEYSRKKAEDEKARLQEEFRENLSVLRESFKKIIMEDRRAGKVSGNKNTFM